VDYVIVAVPRTAAIKVVSDCIKKQVGGATLFTSGFTETDTQEGIELEHTVAQMAREAGFNLIGPNCMGVFNPKIGLRQDVTQYAGIGGPVGFISQSGTHAIFFSVVAESHGIRVSKSVSFGNAAVLDVTDYLEYLAADRETEVIGMYVEGVRDGRKFFQCLRATVKNKPVLIWKGGRTEEAARAAISHTGSLAASQVIWQSMIRQCGAIEVSNLDEMIDSVKALLWVSRPSGTRVGLVAQTGGQSVAIADAFTQEGLTVPLLTDRSYREFASFFNPIGGSYRNPLDVSWHTHSVPDLVKILNIMDHDENVDAVVLELCVPFLTQLCQFDSAYLDDLLTALDDFRAKCAKCFGIVLTAGKLEEEALRIRQVLMGKRLPSFPTFERAAKALRKAAEYHSTAAKLNSLRKWGAKD